MELEFITTDDLEKVKEEILQEIRSFFIEHKIGEVNQRWIRTSDVMKMFKMSAGTLQTLRDNQTIPYTRIGNSLFYDLRDIEKILEENKYKLMNYKKNK